MRKSKTELMQVSLNKLNSHFKLFPKIKKDYYNSGRMMFKLAEALGKIYTKINFIMK
jgi:hypothetical protein